MSINLGYLSKTATAFKKEYIAVRAGMALNLYFADSLHKVAPFIADAIEAYFNFIPKNAIQSYISNNGIIKPFNTRYLNGIKNKLRTMDKVPAFFNFDFLSSNDGSAGEYAMRCIGTRLNDPYLPNETNILRMEFPYAIAENGNVESFMHFVVKVANRIPFCVGNAGFSFNYTNAFRTEGRDAVNTMLPKYYGFDPAYIDCREQMRNHTPNAHWLNLLSNELVEQLGGIEFIKQVIPLAEFRILHKGILIRTALLPPVGDIAKGATDIGLLPSVARLLKPTRFIIGGFGGSIVGIDILNWLNRLDNLVDGKYNNR